MNSKLAWLHGVYTYTTLHAEVNFEFLIQTICTVLNLNLKFPKLYQLFYRLFTSLGRNDFLSLLPPKYNC